MLAQSWARLNRNLEEPARQLPERSRRALVIELLVIVLAVFWTSTGSAVLDLVREVNGLPVRSQPFLITIPGQDLLAVSFATVYLVVRGGAVVGLLAWVLHRSGESFGTIGLNFSRIRGDLLLVLPIAALALLWQKIGFLVGDSTIGTGRVPFVPGHVPAIYVVTAITRSVEAGVVEELVVLAYVLTRLRQLGVHPALAVLVSALIRVSYHAEYGTGALGPLLFGLALGTAYVTTRRLLPAIVVHTGYDIWVNFHDFVFI
jgi:membrane protease YdiL (CAAX protease family)